MKRRIIVLALAVLVLSGCVNGQWRGILGYVDSLNSGTGNSIALPATTVCGVEKEELIEKLMAAAHQKMDSSISISTNGYQVFISKKMSGLRNSYMHGSKFNPIPEERCTITVTKSNERCLYVNGKTEIVTNPNSGHERVSDTTAQNSQELQTMFDAMKASLER